jgi:hypothetical protein
MRSHRKEPKNEFMCNRWSGVRSPITRRGSKAEVKGGLYKVITRDYNRRKIFEAATIENRTNRRPDPDGPGLYSGSSAR